MSQEGTKMKEGLLNKIIKWDGSWPRWRLVMEAASHLMGVGDAFEAGTKAARDEDYKPSEKAAEQSQQLSSIIMLSMDSEE